MATKNPKMATKNTKNTKVRNGETLCDLRGLTFVIFVILVALISVPFAANGQAPSAECPTSPCAQAPSSSSPALTELWRDAAAAHQIKLQFVDALQRFIRAQAGTLGDEAAALGESVASMDRALSAWDAAIAKVQARAVRTAADADTHVALATVWLDRYRLNDALRELDLAERTADRADVHSLRALAFGALNRPQDVVRSLRRVLALEPDNAAAYYTLAQYLQRSGRNDEAVDARRGFERARARAAKRDDSKPIAPFDRVDLLRQTSGVAPVFPQSRYTAGIAKLHAGDYEGAVVTLRNASAADPMVTAPGAVRDRIAQAATMLKDGRLDAALELLRAAADAWPDQSEIHRLLGLVYSIADQQGKSIEHLRRAIALAPGDERARVTLADVLVSERRFAEAERELTAARGSGQVAYRLAQIYQRQSLLEQAVAAMKESDTGGPVIGRDYFYQSWGSLLVNQADFDGAVAAYLRRIEVNPNSGEAHRQLGEIYFLQGRDDEALAEYAVATWLDPGDARALAAAGQAYARMPKYPEAIAALRRALMLDGGLREARYALGTVLMRAGRADEGRVELETFGRQQAEAEALGRREFEVDALRRQASKHALTGESAQAVVLLEQVMALDPQSSRSHRDLGVALLRAKRTAESIDHLQRAQQIDETADGFAQLADAYAAVGDAEASARMRSANQDAVRRAMVDRIKALAR